MSSKVNNYGSNNVYGQSETKKDRVSTGKSFGAFYVGDQEDDLDPQTQSGEEDLGALSDDLGSIFGSFGSSTSSYDRDDKTNNTRSRTTQRTNNKEVEKEDPKAVNKPKQKPEFDKFDKFGKFGEQEEPEKLKEVIKTDALPSFQVPMQVDKVFSPTPIQPTAPLIPTQMVEQIVQDVRLGINEMGVAEFQFDLKSDALEGLKLKVSTKDGQVYATFIAENVHVKETIDQGAQELIKALQDKGLQVANLQVSVGTDSSGTGGQGGFGQGQDQGSQQQNQTYRGYSYAEGSSSTSDSTSDYTNITNTDYTV